MAREQLIPLPWPTGGFVENSSLSEQPGGTTTDCLNVRNFDALDRRLRGGQRTSLEKYLASLVNGSNSIDGIGAVTLAFDSSTVEPSVSLGSIDFTALATGNIVTVDPTNIPFDGENNTGNDAFGTQPATGGKIPRIKLEDGTNALVHGTAFGASSNVGGAAFKTVAVGSSFAVQTNCKFLRSTGTITSTGGIVFEVEAGSVEKYRVRVRTTSTDDLYNVELRSHSGNTLLGTSSNFSLTGSGTYSDPVLFEARVSSSGVAVYINGGKVLGPISISGLGTSSTRQIGLMTFQSVAGEFGGLYLDLNVLTAILPASLRTTKLIVGSGGNVYDGNKDGVSVMTSGTGAYTAGVDLALMPAFQKVYISDGTVSGLKILDSKTRIVTDWRTSITAGAFPVGGGGTTYNITAVDTGAGTFTVAEDLSALISATDSIEVRDSAVENNNRSYTVNTITGTGPTVLTVDQTIQDSSVTGIIGIGNVAPTILALYRGRGVATGLETSPHTIFMSAVGDLLDYDYFPAVTSATMAIASNITKTFGTIGDVVTNWTTYTDDMAIIGMANSLAVLRGDPAAGGAIDIISDKIGIVGREAATFDAGGRFYFMGVNGLYRMDVGTFEPILISQGKLDKTFSEINTALKRVQLLYDPEWQGVHILIKSQSQQTTTADRHYFWDERTDSFWPDEYPLAHGPKVAFRFTADDPTDNAVLFGGWDSGVRQFSDTATDDDGTVISSYCRFSPIVAGDILASSRIHDITVVMDAQSNDVTFKLFTGDTVETAEANADAGTTRFSKILSGGRNTPMRQRVAQNAIIPEISQAGVGGVGATWAFEKAMARIGVLGRMHGRGV